MMRKCGSWLDFEMCGTSSIQHEAAQLSILFDCGSISAAEIIVWADEQIVKMDKPSDSLLSLSMIQPEKTADIISLLHQLGEGADFWSAFRNTLPRFHEFLQIHPEKCEGVANHFFKLACKFKAPRDLNFLYGFDDEFGLARDGIFGKLEDVRENFLRELIK